MNRPDWNLFSSPSRGHRPAGIKGRQAAHDIANREEAERILRDPASYGGDNSLLVEWAQATIARLSANGTKGRG